LVDLFESGSSKRQKVIYHEDEGSNSGAKVSNYMESFEVCSYSDIGEDSSLVGCNAMSNTNRNGLTPHNTLISSVRYHTPGDGDLEKLSSNLFISS
jgi:hypothetical protein